MVAPGTVSRPSSTATTLAMFQPCSPPGMPQPSSTSSIVFGSSSGTLSSAACTIHAASWSGRVSFNAPFPARPIGERAVATMTASGIGSNSSHMVITAALIGGRM